MIVGYRRVSSSDQSLDRQALEGCEKVFEDKLSGKTRDRPGLRQMIDFVREGDEVQVHSIDRLGRSLSDLSSIIEELHQKGVSVRFLSENLAFSAGAADPFQTLQFNMLASFAEFERAIIERRRLEGIEAAKASGRYRAGSPRRQVFDVEEALRMYDEGHAVRDIAKTLGGSKTTVHREIVGRRKSPDPASDHRISDQIMPS